MLRRRRDERAPGEAGQRIGLALSGGGYRAAVFHLGVLKRLAQAGLLEKVSVVSSVSGGSLVVAGIIAKSDNRWPTSHEYLETVYPALRRLITSTDLMSVSAVGWTGLLRFNRKLASQRASVVAGLLESSWGVTGHLKDLPESPIWWINTTCLETGKNWRFSKREMGDWVFGKHYEPPFKIAEAAAASAAVPYVIGALPFPLPKNGWYRTDPEKKKRVAHLEPPTRTVRLWDGGAYENLGLEPILKAKGLLDCDLLICSDASGPVATFKWSSPTALLRGGLWSPRLFDVASDQIRSLRSRMFMQAVDNKQVRGSLLKMGNSIRSIDVKTRRERPAAAYDGFQSEDDVKKAFYEPTGLKAYQEDTFDRISRHGFEVCEATLSFYLPDLLPRSRTWNDGPR